MYWITVVLGALGIFLGSANPVWHVPLAMLAYPAALYALSAGPEPFRRGWLCGWLGSSAALYWIAVPVHDYGGMSWFLAVPCPLLLGAYVALWGGLFCKAMAWLRAKEQRFGLGGWSRRCAVAGLLWYTLEWARGWFLTGFPWLTLASGQAAWPLLIQGVSLMGAYGLSGVLAWLACAVTEGVQSRIRGPFLAAAGMAGLLLTYGAVQINQGPDGEPLEVALIQGNISQDVKWTEPFQKASLEKYLRLSREAVEKNPGVELIIWPETAMPFYYQRSYDFAKEIRDFAKATGTALLFGGPGVKPDTQDTFNRAFLVDKQGRNAGTYDKEHLVPYGEYVPWYLGGRFAEGLFFGPGGGFTPGMGGQPLDMGAEPCGQCRNAGMLICYEAIFPELARERVARGATLLVNISNDAWYNYTSAAAQHLHLSLLRAVEQNRWMARATNTGISAFVDPTGRIHHASHLFTDAAIAATVELRQTWTLFFWLQPWLPLLALAALGFLIYPFCLSHKRRKSYVASA